MTYSLIGIALAFAAGIFVAPFFTISPFALWGGATASLLVSFLAMRFRRRFLLGLFIAVGLLGILRYQTAQPPFAQLYDKALTLREVTGTVVSYPDLGAGYTAFTFQPDHLQGKIRVTWFWEGKERPSLSYGDRLRLTGSVRVPKRFPDFDYRAYLARQGIFATMAIDHDDTVESRGVSGSRLLRLGDTLRQNLLERLDRTLPPQEASLAHSLLFGERATLSDEVEEAFRRTGLMHLLAVSGLHLGIFLAGLWFILRRLGLRPLFTYPLVGIAVLLVLWVVGPRVSLVRATLLFAFLALGSVLADLGVILRRWISHYHGLAAAALVVLAIRPTALADVGFQLSFGATAAILFVFDPAFHVQAKIDALAERSPFPAWSVRYPLSLLIVSAAAQAGTAPFLAYHFGAIHPLVLVSNLTAIPLATIALWLGLFTLFLSWTPLIGPLGTLLSSVLRGLIVLVEWLGRLPGAETATPSWMGIWIGGIVCYFFLLALYLRDSSS
jgi:competence protein ComEC